MNQFFICERCKNLIGMIDNKGVPIMCCGVKMEEIVPNTVDAAVEKHTPVVTKLENGGIKVDVGSVAHPMTPEHYIEFIYVATKKGGQRKSLTPDDANVACFSFVDDEPTEVYAYCNTHGLWKVSL